MTTKIIVITTRWPRNRSERKIYGEANTKDGISKIFINKPMNKKSTDHVDTLYHELTHAITGFYETKLSDRQEEKLCRAIGKAAMEAFKNA